MSDNITFNDISPDLVGTGPGLTGAGQLTALSGAGAEAVNALINSFNVPQIAPDSGLNGSVFTGGGNFLTSANGTGGNPLIPPGTFNPSNNTFNPAGQ